MPEDVSLLIIGIVILLLGLAKLAWAGNGSSGSGGSSRFSLRNIGNNTAINIGSTNTMNNNVGPIGPASTGSQKRDWIGLIVAAIGLVAALVGLLKVLLSKG